MRYAVEFLLPALAAATLIGASDPLLAQASREYRLSVVANRPIPIVEGAYRWAELVGERTQGRLRVRVFPASSLVGGDQTAELTALRQGTIDLLVASTINLSPAIRQMNLFSLPFLMPDAKAFDAIVASAPGRELFRLLEDRDAMPLAWGDNGFRELSNSRRAVRTPADLRGLKIRYAASPIFSETLSALGANPTQMSFVDLQPALSTGAVDGQENSVTLFMVAKMEQLGQRHLTLWHYVSDAAIFMVRRRVWEGWTAADQAIVRQAAIEGSAEITRRTRQGQDESDDSALRELAQRGVAVVRLSEAERADFRARTKAVYDKWRQIIGPELVHAAEDAVARRQ